MKKYMIPLASMLACNEIISTAALLVLVVLVMVDIVRAAENKI